MYMYVYHIYIHTYIIYIYIYKTDNFLFHTIILNHFHIKLKNFIIIFPYASPTGSRFAVISICYIAKSMTINLQFFVLK